MNYAFLHRKNNPRLLVLFAGWGMDYHIFGNLHHGAYDIIVVWDYRLLFDPPTGTTRPFGYLLSVVSKYQEICILAWSMGVYAAQQIMDRLPSTLSRCIAVNGTVNPIDDYEGIPEAIYDATLQHLDATGWFKFCRRMWGGAGRLAEMADRLPKRSIEDLIEELQVLGEGARQRSTLLPHDRWDLAILTDGDAIFPIENQRRSWRRNSTIELRGCHVPDFQWIIDHWLIDKLLVRDKFSSAVDSYLDNAGIQQLMGQRLADDLKSNFDLASCQDPIIELGCGTGGFTRLYAGQVTTADWQLWDIAEVPAGVGEGRAKVRQCDAELALRELEDDSVGCIVSNCVVQWFGSPIRFLHESLRALRPGGVLAFSTFGPDNMREVTMSGGATRLMYPTLAKWLAMVPDGIETVCVSQREETRVFDTPRQVMEHMRLTGVNAAGQSSPADARRILESYPRDKDGRCPLTYDCMHILLRKNG